MCTSLDPPSTKSNWLQEGTIRKLKQDKGDMRHIQQGRKYKSWNNYKIKGLNIHFFLLGDGAITNNFTKCEGVE
jgi:hypothetical protein